MRDPYYIDVGLQDNGNWLGPSNTRERAGIFNSHWVPTGGGDGYYAQFDPGRVVDHVPQPPDGRHRAPQPQDRASPSRVRPEAPAGRAALPLQLELAHLPLAPRPQRPLFRRQLPVQVDRPGLVLDQGQPGPDDQRPGQAQGLGRPDRRQHRGREPLHHPDHHRIAAQGRASSGSAPTTARSRSAATAARPGRTSPPTSRASARATTGSTRIEASHFVEGGVYLTVSRHQVDDYRPYIFKSEDFGKTWVSLRGDLPEYGYLHTVRESPSTANLLFVGSEFGLFVSGDGGRTWIPFKGEFPTVAVRDIQIHPREHDLVIGTHGRGVWIVDDIRPLERLTAEAAKADALLFDVKDATLFSYRTTVDNYSDAGYAGDELAVRGGHQLLPQHRRPSAARKLKLAVLDKDGREVGDAVHDQGARPQPRLLEPPRRGGGGVAGAGGGGARPRPGGMSGLAPYALPGEYKAVLEAGGPEDGGAVQGPRGPRPGPHDGGPAGRAEVRPRVPGPGPAGPRAPPADRVDDQAARRRRRPGRRR
ncbi:MAG: hypothetical protein MZU79_07430 [Anaerotruncus sp.]|nr:hypothetical protein [Anaerotruncus sp.]